MFSQISILGVGLLGASLAMAVRKHCCASTINVWARKKTTLDRCAEEVWCDQVFEDVQESVRGSNLIIICTPVDSISGLMADISSHLNEGAIVTDVGSVKENICTSSQEIFKNSKGVFIGAHPMAGSEKSGLENAQCNLFEGKTCVVTPDEFTCLDALEKLKDFWRKLNMDVHEFSASEHDRAVAYFSHLPHIISSALSESLLAQPIKWRNVSGNGLKDTTRIAAGDPRLWEQICMMNSENLVLAIENTEKSLAKVKKSIQSKNNEDLFSFLKDGSKFRKSI